MPATVSSNTTAQQKIFGMSRISWWSVLGTFFITFFSAPFHFIHELSNYNRAVAFFGSVNESTWEHLKFYFWAGCLWALIEYAYKRNEVNNFWVARAAAFWITPIVICAVFYGYLSYTLPRYGSGFLWADIGSGIIAVIVAQIVASHLLQQPPVADRWRRLAPALIGILLVANSLFTYFPPKFFLFEDYNGYEYAGKYGILEYEDYDQRRIFTTSPIESE